MFTLFTVSALVMSVSDAKRDALASLIAVLELKKGKGHQGYVATYDVGPHLGLALNRETRQYISYGGKEFYADTVTDSWGSRVLLRSTECYWIYKDTLVGPHYFKGLGLADHESPEDWFHKHEFIHNSYANLDARLIKAFTDLISQATINQVRHNGSHTELSAASDVMGTFVVQYGGNAFVVIGADKAVVLRLTHRAGGQDAVDVADVLVNEFANTKAIRKLDATFTQISALADLFGELGVTKSLSADEAESVAKAGGLLAPSKTKALIRKATTYFRQLAYEFDVDSARVLIVQYPPGSRPKDDASLAPFVSKRRSADGYAVVEVRDPGVNSRHIYYLRENVALVVSGAVAFESKALDDIIADFRQY